MMLLLSTQHFSDPKCFNLKLCVETVRFASSTLIITRKQLFILLGWFFFPCGFNLGAVPAVLTSLRKRQ